MADTQAAELQPTELQRGLKQRHLTMIAIGGVIGAGLFVGSGVVINETGPAAFLSYLVTGVLIILVMDARRDGDRQPVDGLVRRLRPSSPRWLGGILGGLAVLVLLGDRRRLRGGG